jgi:hypothetical protein
MGVNVTSVLLIFAIGAALMAFWAVARFPSLGPQAFITALLVTVVAFALQSQLPAAVTAVATSSGIVAALLFVVLPALTLLFWTSGCLVRSLIAMIAPHVR